MQQGLEFDDVETPRGVQAMERRLREMIEVVSALQQYFDGEINNVAMIVTDKQGNRKQTELLPLSLTVDYYLTIQEIRYLKSIDPYLIAVM